MFFLHIPGSDVVDVGVSPDMVHGLFLGNTAASGADDYAEFCLIVECLGQVQVGINVVSRGDDRGWRLGEHDGIIRDMAVAGGCIESGVGEFLGVVEVVATDAEDVATRARDRREQVNVAEGEGGVAQTDVAGAGCDDREHVLVSVERGDGVGFCVQYARLGRLLVLVCDELQGTSSIDYRLF